MSVRNMVASGGSAVGASLSYGDFAALLYVLQAKISGLDLADPAIYAVPRGGLVPAVYLSHRLGIPLVFSPDRPGDTLVVDDILDTGATYRRLSGAAAYYAVLLARKALPKVIYGRMYDGPWVEFPWEVGGRPIPARAERTYQGHPSQDR